MRLQLWTAGWTNQLNWLLVAAWLVAAIPLANAAGGLFAQNAWWREGPVAFTEGEVVSIQENPTRGGRERDKIYSVRYRYTAANGQAYNRTSYTTGRPQDLAPGDRVVVEYRRDRPAVSRIQGMRDQPQDAATGLALCTGILLVIGFLPLYRLVTMTLLPAWQAARLLSAGVVTSGTVKASVRKGASIDRGLSGVLFYFPAGGDKPQPGYMWWAHLAPPPAPDAALDVLYDPARPRNAVLLAGIPGGVRFAPSGELAAPPEWQIVLRLILPAAALLLPPALLLWQRLVG